MDFSPFIQKKNATRKKSWKISRATFFLNISILFTVSKFNIMWMQRNEFERDCHTQFLVVYKMHVDLHSHKIKFQFQKKENQEDVCRWYWLSGTFHFEINSVLFCI